MNSLGYKAFSTEFEQDLNRGSTNSPWLETLTLNFYRNANDNTDITTSINLVMDFKDHTINSVSYSPVQMKIDHASLSLADFKSFTATLQQFDPQMSPLILDAVSRVSEDVRPADAIYRMYKYDNMNYTLYQNIEAFIMGQIGFSVERGQINIKIVAGEPNLETTDFPNTYFNSAEFPGIETTLGDAGTIRVRKSS